MLFTEYKSIHYQGDSVSLGLSIFLVILSLVFLVFIFGLRKIRPVFALEWDDLKIERFVLRCQANNAKIIPYLTPPLHHVMTCRFVVKLELFEQKMALNEKEKECLKELLTERPTTPQGIGIDSYLGGSLKNFEPLKQFQLTVERWSRSKVVYRFSTMPLYQDFAALNESKTVTNEETIYSNHSLTADYGRNYTGAEGRLLWEARLLFQDIPKRVRIVLKEGYGAAEVGSKEWRAGHLLLVIDRDSFFGSEDMEAPYDHERVLLDIPLSPEDKYWNGGGAPGYHPNCMGYSHQEEGLFNWDIQVTDNWVHMGTVRAVCSVKHKFDRSSRAEVRGDEFPLWKEDFYARGPQGFKVRDQLAYISLQSPAGNDHSLWIPFGIEKPLVENQKVLIRFNAHGYFWPEWEPLPDLAEAGYEATEQRAHHLSWKL